MTTTALDFRRPAKARLHARRIRVAAMVLYVAVVAACTPVLVTEAAPLRVLVANDDGVSAEGISVLVSALTANRQLQVEVFAPATNQSGTGDNFTTKPIEVFSTTTKAGYPATAVKGFPADGVFFGILQGMSRRPDLVVSGVNEGQNIGNLVTLSGTVGAALTGARLGIPGFAVSQGLGAGIRYDAAAAYVAGLAETFRTNASFRRIMLSSRDVRRAHVLNVNFPTCTSGTLRGVRAVVLGQGATVVGYEPLPAGTWSPVGVRVPFGSNDCTSKLRNPQTDLEAMNNGFASATLLNIDLTNDEGVQRIRSYVED